MEIQQINMVRLQSLERGFDRSNDVLCRETRIFRVASNFGGDNDVVAVSSLTHPLANNLLGHSGGIRVSGINQIAAKFDEPIK